MENGGITTNTQPSKDIYFKFFAICTALGGILMVTYLFCGGIHVKSTSSIKLIEVGTFIILGIGSLCALASDNFKIKIIWVMYATFEFMFALHLVLRYFKIH